jgi:hypothetical protein
MGGCPSARGGKGGRKRSDRKAVDKARRKLGGKAEQTILCNDLFKGQVSGKWHNEHYCQVPVPVSTKSHSGSHKCSCGHTW